MKNDPAQILKSKRGEILRIAAQHGARNVRVFGSVARGEADPQSNVDLLVEMEPGRSLFDLARLLNALQDLLDCHVDLVDQGGLDRYIRDRILSEAVLL